MQDLGFGPLPIDRLVGVVLLPQVLRSTEGNPFQAARILGIARRTLRPRLRELGLSVTKSVAGDEDDAIAPE